MIRSVVRLAVFLVFVVVVLLLLLLELLHLGAMLLVHLEQGASNAFGPAGRSLMDTLHLNSTCKP